MALNIYYDMNLLVLGHVLNPALRFNRLVQSKVSPPEVFGTLSSFTSKHCSDLIVRFSDEAGAPFALKKDFCTLVMPPDLLLGEFQISTDCDSFSPLRNCMDFNSDSILRQVCRRLHSIRAHAADIERAWSSRDLGRTLP